MVPSSENQLVVRRLETKAEIEEALKLYSIVALKNIPTLLTLKITPELYYNRFLKYWVDPFLQEKLSYGVFDKNTNKIVCAQLNLDLFADFPEELSVNRELDPILDRDEAVCIKAYKEYLKEGVIQEKKNRYLYLVIGAREETIPHGFIKEINHELVNEARKRGFEYHYVETISPAAQRIWTKRRPDHVKKISLADFEDGKGNKPFEGVDWKKFGYPDEKPSFYSIVTRMRKDGEEVTPKL